MSLSPARRLFLLGLLTLVLELAPDQALSWMVRTERWKYIYYEGFPPQLFDMAEDPQEQRDFGQSPDHSDVRADLHERLFTWLRHLRSRRTISDDQVAQRTASSKKRGFLIGEW